MVESAGGIQPVVPATPVAGVPIVDTATDTPVETRLGVVPLAAVVVVPTSTVPAAGVPLVDLAPTTLTPNPFHVHV